MRIAATLGVALLTAGPAVFAQGVSSAGASASSRATPLPASGRTSAGSATAKQTAANGTGVATLSSSVDVTGNVTGSAASLSDRPASLTLKEALDRALRNNLGPATAGNASRSARAQRLQELSALLPSISANLSETVAQVNLAAYGLKFSSSPGLGFSFPTVVGPYSYSQAQGQLSQSVFDLTAIRNWKASKESERASVQAARDTRELVALAVGGTYLQAVATAARIESQRAQVESSQAVYQQSTVRKQAGTNAKIDVVRSLVELQTQQQRLSSLEATYRKQKIDLARIIGIALDHDPALSEKLNGASPSLPDLDGQIQTALHNRADLRAVETQVRAAEIALSAARAERAPSASVSGNYGVIGPNPSTGHGTFTVTGSVNVPIWQGGRVGADILQAESTLGQRQAEFADQRGKVEADVRSAHVDLETALGQLKVAESNRSYARETLAEARDRYAAGVATTVEVVQAQEQVAGAENDYVSSLFSLQLARLSLARATGSGRNRIA